MAIKRVLQGKGPPTHGAVFALPLKELHTNFQVASTCTNGAVDEGVMPCSYMCAICSSIELLYRTQCPMNDAGKLQSRLKF